jgi:hypothetical protein
VQLVVSVDVELALVGLTAMLEPAICFRPFWRWS